MCLPDMVVTMRPSPGARTYRFLGNIRVSSSGKRTARKADSDAIGLERRQLAQILHEQASARHPHTIKFKFGLQCVGAVLEDKVVTFRPCGSAAHDELIKERFDFLIGADGQNSRVRDLLEDQVSASLL